MNKHGSTFYPNTKNTAYFSNGNLETGDFGKAILSDETLPVHFSGATSALAFHIAVFDDFTSHAAPIFFNNNQEAVSSIAIIPINFGSAH